MIFFAQIPVGVYLSAELKIGEYSMESSRPQNSRKHKILGLKNTPVSCENFMFYQS